MHDFPNQTLLVIGVIILEISSEITTGPLRPAVRNTLTTRLQCGGWVAEYVQEFPLLEPVPRLLQWLTNLSNPVMSDH